MNRYISMMVILCALLLPVLTGCSGGGGGDSVGPAAVTRWQQVNAPEGGTVNDLAVDPGDHLTLYAATDNGGVFKSTNGGASWSRVNSGLGRMQVYCIAVDPNNSQTIYAGTDYGVYRSTNGAASWSAVNSGLGEEGRYAEMVLSLSIDPTDSRIIFAGCAGGVYKSSNAGGSWNTVYGGLSILSVAVVPGNGQIIYAGTTSGYGSDSGRTADDLGILKSSDGGRSWQTVNNDALGVRTILVDSTNSSIVYASAGNGFFKSTDAGESWNMVHGTEFDDTATVAGSQTLYALVSDGLSSSTDGGVNWNVAGTPLDGTGARSLVVDPANSQTIYVGTYSAGVFKSMDGGVSWSAVNTGLTATDINAAVIAGQGDMQDIFVGTRTGLFKSSDAGASWSVTGDRHPVSVNSLAVDPRSAQTLYAGRDYWGVFKSGNGGESWSAVNEGFGVEFSDPFFTAYHNTESFAVDPADGSIYAGTSSGIFKSSNGGNSWGAAGTTSLTGHILALAIDPARKGTVYAGTWDGVFKSVDGGATWMAINAGLPASTTIYSLVIDPSNTQTLYAGSSFDVYRSTDGGNSWTVTARTSLTSVNALAIDPITQTVYAGRWGALYKTTDGGSSWSLVNIPVAMGERITAIAISGTTLCAVTSGGAVFIGSTAQ